MVELSYYLIILALNNATQINLHPSYSDILVGINT